jgi:hypothetical protein
MELTGVVEQDISGLRVTQMLVFVIAAHLSTPLNTREPSGDLPVPMAVTGAVWAIAARMAELELTATFSQDVTFVSRPRCGARRRAFAESNRFHMDRATISFYVLTHAIVNL